MTDSRDIADLVDRLGRVAHRVQYAGGLNPSQWEALRFLARANRYSRNPKSVADYLGLTKGTVSQTLNALESKGYIARTRGETDRRSVQIVLTPAGHALMEEDPLRALQRASSDLPSDQHETVTSALNAIISSVQSNGTNASFGACRECDHLVPSEQEEAPPVCKCALTMELLAPEELDKICVDFDAQKAEPRKTGSK